MRKLLSGLQIPQCTKRKKIPAVLELILVEADTQRQVSEIIC